MTSLHARPLPALLYHAVGTPPTAADPLARALFVAPDRFAWQMKSLAKRGFRTASLQEYAAALEGRCWERNTLLLTFDDAYAHVDEVVTPILRRHRFSAVMFAPWRHLGGRNTWDEDEHPALSALEVVTAEQLKAMDEGPWEVASHATLHIDLRKLGGRERRAQLEEAREGLSELLGRPVRELAYPYGDQNAAVREDARAVGYRMAFVAGTSPGADVLRLPRRPISGNDGQLMFRLKTSAGSELLYAARRVLREAGRWGAHKAVTTS